MGEFSGPPAAWTISDPIKFLATVLFLGVAIRLVHSVLRTIGQSSPLKNFWARFWKSFGGFHNDPDDADYWYNWIIGLFELAGYAVFIATNSWAPIAAWIGLKAVAQWDLWRSHRKRFNLFLIGNLLVLAAALLSLLDGLAPWRLVAPTPVTDTRPFP